MKHEQRVFSRRRFIHVASVGALGALAAGFPAEALAASNTRTFTDSLGRKVSIAGMIESVTPLGNVAQAMMCTLCPEELASLASEIDETDMQEYAEAGITEIADLPVTGGGSSSTVKEVDVTEVDAVNPGLMLDVGLAKEGLVEELDTIQAETGVPCAFIDVSFGNLSQAYRTLGDLLGYRARAEDLACYIEKTLARVDAGSRDVPDTCNVFYAPRSLGLEVKSSISVQLNAIAHIGATPVASAYDYMDKTVNLDALTREKVDLVVFDDTDCLDSLVKMEGETWDIWSGVPAVAEGMFAISPALMYSWFGSLVYVQSLGVLWLASIIWPETYPLDMAAESEAFYNLFYGLNRGKESMTELIGEYCKEGYANE